MSNFDPRQSLGAQGWWNVLKYLIIIGDWPAAIGMLRPSKYRWYEDSKHKAEEEWLIKQQEREWERDGK